MERGGPSRTQIALAFAAIYLIWGSTFLAIRYAIETLPPFFMMGCRSLLAGVSLYGWARLRGGGGPPGAHWAAAAVMGTLLFVGGHGALAWGEQRVPSGIAALIMATIPLWMTLLQALHRGGRAPTGRAAVGLVLGFGGIALLAEPVELLGGTPVDLTGAGVLLLGAFSWSVGSVFSRGVRLPGSPTLTAAMTLLSGGMLLLLISRLSGETVDTAAVSARSLMALTYLAVFGSIIAFAAYVWLLRVTSPARVSTYAFVNPAVAVLLGSVVGGEPLTLQILTASFLMIAGVAAIVAAPRLVAEKPMGNAKGLKNSVGAREG